MWICCIFCTLNLHKQILFVSVWCCPPFLQCSGSLSVASELCQRCHRWGHSESVRVVGICLLWRAGDCPLWRAGDLSAWWAGDLCLLWMTGDLFALKGWGLVCFEGLGICLNWWLVCLKRMGTEWGLINPEGLGTCVCFEGLETCLILRPGDLSALKGWGLVCIEELGTCYLERLGT